MIQYTVLIPQRDHADVVARRLPEVCRLLEARGAEYEIICVDDGSTADNLKHLCAHSQRYPGVRVLPLERSGISTALTAGIQAARGEVVIAMEASDQYEVEQMDWLVDRLARAHLVIGRRPRQRLTKIALAMLHIPRRVLLGLDARDPDCLFWAARREALEGLTLSRGMHRFLAPLVSMRGFRVGEIHIEHRPHHFRPSPDIWLASGNLLLAWRMKRRLKRYDQAIATNERSLNKRRTPLNDHGPDARTRIDAAQAAGPAHRAAQNVRTAQHSQRRRGR